MSSKEERMIRVGFGVLTEAAPLAPSFEEIGDGSLVQPRERRLPRLVTPILAAVAVFALIGVPALLLGSSPEEVGSAPAQQTEPEGFPREVLGWGLIAVIHEPDTVGLAVYVGPMPDTDGEMVFITGERGFWPPRDKDGEPLLIYGENSDVPVKLSDRPYAFVKENEGDGEGAVKEVAIGDPIDLIDASKLDGVSVLERSERVDIKDQAKWEAFLAAVQRDR